jgi:hypothetical protein
VPQPVLAELFTIDGCTHCPDALEAMEYLAKYVYGSSRVILLEYHIQDGYSTSYGSNLYGEYGLRGTPAVILNGGVPIQMDDYSANPIYGGPSREYFDSVIKKVVSQQSSVSIEATVTTGKIDCQRPATNLSLKRCAMRSFTP